MKRCKKCNEEFDGKYCKPCRAAYMRVWNANNPEKVKESKKKKYQKNKKIIDKKNNEWAKKNRERSNAIKKAHKDRNREKYLIQQREYARERYRSNAEEERLKQNERRKQKKEWYEENKDRINAGLLERYHSNEDVKEKYRVRGRVRYAVVTGKLIKPKNCSDCGEEKKLEAHHEDYSKPLDVIWVCRMCHKKLHRIYAKQ